MTLAIVPTPEPLAKKFRDLDIETVTYVHDPVFTVEEGQHFKSLISGGHTKNLFLKDKKGVIWLVTALWETEIDLRKLSDALGAARFSFGKPELLLEVLGVTPGSVTPLALINDSARRVRPVLDAALLACETANCHPLQNDKTTSIRPEDLVKFMRDMGYNPLTVDFKDMTCST